MKNVVACFVIVAVLCGAAFAQEKAEEENASSAASSSSAVLDLEKTEVERPVNQGHKLPDFKRRVPDGFAKLINGAQRDKVYEIQQEYYVIIETLKARIAAMEAECNNRMEMVLEEKQRDELRRSREESREKSRTAAENRRADKNEKKEKE